MRQSQSGISWLVFFALTIIILGGAWFYTNWQSSQEVLPPQLTINGVPMGGMTEEQALQQIALAYTSPITVYYEGEVSLLLPEMVELTLDMESTAENLEAALRTQTQAVDFFDYLLDQLLRREPEVLDVKAFVPYSREGVDDFLLRIAQKYDRSPQDPVSLPEAGTFRPARDGTTLDIDASRPKLIEAILAADPELRQVTLVVDVEVAPEASISLLQDAIAYTLQDFDGIAGVFIKGFSGGQELCLNCRVAFSGEVMLKIATVMELYRTLAAAPDAQLSTSINATLTSGEGTAADLVLSQIGSGSPYSGALKVSAFLTSLGLQSSFLSTPYTMDAAGLVPNTATPANSRTDITTNPHAYVQSTPAETALLLEGVYQCARDSGFLRILYPLEIQVQECSETMTGLERSQRDMFFAAGIPPEARVAHKYAWGDSVYADVGVVYGTTSDFVLVVYLYQPTWTTWEDSSAIFANIGQLAYRFFNGDN